MRKIIGIQWPPKSICGDHPTRKLKRGDDEPVVEQRGRFRCQSVAPLLLDRTWFLLTFQAMQVSQWLWGSPPWYSELGGNSIDLKNLEPKLEPILEPLLQSKAHCTGAYTNELFNLTLRPKLGPLLGPKLRQIKSLLNCHPEFPVGGLLPLDL